MRSIQYYKAQNYNYSKDKSLLSKDFKPSCPKHGTSKKATTQVNFEHKLYKYIAQ